MTDSCVASGRRLRLSARPARWWGALGLGAVTAAVVGVPTDVIANPWFTRMTPTRWWDYVVLAATTGLTAVWVLLPGPAVARGYRTPVASALGALAVGCPVCNKLVVGLLGVSGALAVWAPLQPVLGAVSIGLILLAIVAKWRSAAEAEGAGSCPVR